MEIQISDRVENIVGKGETARYFPDMPILDSSSSTVNKDRKPKMSTNGDTDL